MPSPSSYPLERFRTVAATCQVLGDSCRFSVLQVLTTGEKTPAELAELIEVPATTLGNHLRVLTLAGLLAPSLRGRNRLHSLTDEGRRVAGLVACLGDRVAV